MKVTINDIAKVAKVSKSTVSKVLNDDPTISDKTKLKVRKIMSDMNYTPNSLARHLARQKSYTIGLLIDTDHKDYYLNPFFYNLLGGVEQVVCSNDYELTISNLRLYKEKKDFLSKYVYNKRVSGLVLPASVLTEEIIHTLNDLKFPYIVIGQTKNILDVSWVDVNNVLGGELATSHLIKQGYKEFAFIGGNSDEPISYSRQLGYRNVLFSQNIPSSNQNIASGPANEEAGYNLTYNILLQKPTIDALLCVNNYVAYGALQAIKKLNLKSPEDIGIVTFDDFPLAPYTTPKLTALEINTFELGQLAATILLKKIEHYDTPHQVSLLTPKLIIRNSSQKL